MLESNDFYLSKDQSNTIRLRPYIIPDGSCLRGKACCSPCKLIEIFGKINPLQTTENGRGIVSVRVALLLRTTEIKPCSLDLFRLFKEYLYTTWTILPSHPLRSVFIRTLHTHTHLHTIPLIITKQKTKQKRNKQTSFKLRVLFFLF